MTQPESHSQPTAPQPEETTAREFEAIEIDDLDKENKGWVKSYLETMKTRLADEQGAEVPDFVMIAYIKREIDTYQDLLDRNEKK